MTPRKNTTAVILAGGQGRRFACQDKGLIRWRDRALIEHVIERLSPQVKEIIISCNRNTKTYQQFGYPTIKDLDSGFRGPLTGIAAALSICTSQYVVICPCDSPSLPSDLVERLETSLINGNADIAVAFDGHRLQYLFALLNIENKHSLNDYLNRGLSKVGDWYETLNKVEVDFSDNKEAFVNINRPEDLNSLK